MIAKGPILTRVPMNEILANCYAHESIYMNILNGNAKLLYTLKVSNTYVAFTTQKVSNVAAKLLYIH